MFLLLLVVFVLRVFYIIVVGGFFEVLFERKLSLDLMGLNCKDFYWL